MSFHTPNGRLALRTAITAVPLLLGLAAWPVSARADSDHEKAREAVARGEVLPLSTVLQRLERSHPGQVLEVELEREQGRWIYEIRLLQPGGRLMKLEVDARSAEVLSQRRKEP